MVLCGRKCWKMWREHMSTPTIDQTRLLLYSLTSCRMWGYTVNSSVYRHRLRCLFWLSEWRLLKECQWMDWLDPLYQLNADWLLQCRPVLMHNDNTAHSKLISLCPSLLSLHTYTNIHKRLYNQCRKRHSTDQHCFSCLCHAFTFILIDYLFD